MTKIPPEASYVEISKNTSQESVIGLIVGFIVILIVIAVVVLIFIRRRQLALCGSNAEKGKYGHYRTVYFVKFLHNPEPFYNYEPPIKLLVKAGQTNVS